MSAQTTSELHRAVASSVFLSNVVGGRGAFVSGLSDIVILQVDVDNISRIYIRITERSSNRSCMIDLWDHPLSFGGRATNLVSWGWDIEHLKVLIFFLTAQAARAFGREALRITFRWIAEQDDNMLANLLEDVEAHGDL